MAIDPREIDQSDEQRVRIADRAENTGKDWRQLLRQVVTFITSLNLKDQVDADWLRRQRDAFIDLCQKLDSTADTSRKDGL